jgi:hypothetical protein
MSSNQRLHHDTAFAAAIRLVEVIENILRPEDRRECRSEFYLICKAALEAYDVQRERMEQRMRPSSN